MKSCHVSLGTFLEDINSLEVSSMACISITDVCQSSVELNPNWKKSLALKFYDIDSKLHPYAFKEEQAEKTIQYMLEVFNTPGIEELVIHCHAGISRSRAFHCFYQYYIVKDKQTLDNPPAYIGNAMVYNMLVQVYMDKYYDL